MVFFFQSIKNVPFSFFSRKAHLIFPAIVAIIISELYILPMGSNDLWVIFIQLNLEN